jgi:hypothetical protein
MSAPDVDIRQVVTAAWQRVLRLEEVPADTGFFDLGGDSLAAARVCAAIQSGTGRVLSLQAFIAGPTIAGLVSTVESLPRAAGPKPSQVADPVGREPLPALPAQENYLRRDAWSRATGIYDNPLTMVLPLRLRGRLDVEALSTAVTAAGRHHAALRARFGPGPDGGDHVVRIDEQDVRLRVEQAADLNRVREAYEAAVRLRPDRASGIELSGFRLHRLAEDDHVLLAWVDHVIADGWSLDVLLDDLAILYNAAAGGNAATLPEAPSYQRFHADALAWERSAEALRARAFWIEALKEVGPEPTIDFLGAPRGPRPPAAQQDRLRLAVPPALYTAAATHPGATPFAVFCAGLALGLGRHSGRDRLGFITAAARRADPAVERLVGWLSNTIVVPIALDPGETLRELLGRVCASVVGAVDHSAYGRNSLIREFAPDTFGTVRRHAGVFVSVETAAADDGTEFRGLDVELLPWAPSFSRHGVSCTLRDSGKAAATLRIEADWLDDARRRHLGEDLETALRLVLEEPECTVARAMSVMSGPDDWYTVKV